MSVYNVEVSKRTILDGKMIKVHDGQATMINSFDGSIIMHLLLDFTLENRLVDCLIVEPQILMVQNVKNVCFLLIPIHQLGEEICKDNLLIWMGEIL